MPGLPQIPADLSSLNDDDLSSLVDQFRRFFAENRENATTAEAVAELRQAADAVASLTSEASRRQEEITSALADIDAVFGGDDSDGAGTAGVEDAVAASGGARQPTLEAMARFRPAAQAARPQPVGNVRVVTAAGVRLQGDPRDALVEEVVRALTDRGRTTVEGVQHLASIQWAYPEGRRLSAEDATSNTALIAAALSGGVPVGSNPDALVAASILCAPTQPYYEQLVLAGAERPVRDALVGFGATRGGVRFMPPPQMADVASGITTIAADPGTTSKPVVQVTCPTPQEVQVTAVPLRIQFDNFNSRAWPEQVAAILAVGAAQQAKVAETYLLDGIATASTAVTAAKGFGAGRQLLANIITAAAGYRSRQRMQPDAVVEVLLPSWAPDLMRADLVRSWHDEMDFMALTDEQIASMFAAAHVRPTYYLDSKTGGAQILAAQAAGPLNTFPNNLFMYFFAPGTFLYVDGGTLDFGLYRDSTLNAANKYEVMVETFENVAKVGLESVELRATVCADGTYAPSGTALTCPV